MAEDQVLANEENEDFGPRPIETLESEVLTLADIRKLKAMGFATVDAL